MWDPWYCIAATRSHICMRGSALCMVHSLQAQCSLIGACFCPQFAPTFEAGWQQWLQGLHMHAHTVLFMWHCFGLSLTCLLVSFT